MTRDELKSEIIKAVDTLPQSVLPQLLEHIKSVKKNEINRIIDNIMKEDHDLLKRLSD